MDASGSPKIAIPVEGGVLPPPLMLVPPTTPTSGAVIAPPPATLRAEELLESTYRPQLELTLAVPPTVTAPDAVWSREYTHDPDPRVTATAAVETGTVFHPKTFMKYVFCVCETSTSTAFALAAYAPEAGGL